MADRGSATPARGMVGWIAFDFAAIPCFGIVNIFIFAPYFAAHLVGGAVRGQSLWGFGQATAGLLIALLAPIVGAATDRVGPRKPLFALFGTLSFVALVSLGLASSAPTVSIMTVLACVVAFSLGIEFMVVVHNAMLPALVSEQRIGRWSGWSFAAGYFATVTALALVLCAPETLRLPGLPVLTREQASGPFMALWLAICMTPFFLWTPDRRRHESSVRSAIAEGLCSLGATFRTARHYSNIWRYMIARAIFYDGLLAIFLFSGIFAAGSYGWDIARLAALGIAQFLAAAIGAAILAPLDDRVGSKRMLMCSVTLVGCGTALLLLIAPHNPPAATESMRGPFLFLSQLGFATYSEQAYFLCTAATNFFLGPALAASRTMVARLAPHELMGQFFGLFSLLGRATSFAAPLIIGVTTAMTQSQRLGFATVLLFIVAGLLLLTTVREERSILAASDPRTDSGRHDRSG